MSDPYEALFPPDDEEQVPDWYACHVAGSYQSNWELLRFASASNFLQATRALAHVISARETALNRGQSEAETSFVLRLNWRVFVSGPLLAATVMPSFALEAFLRHCAEVALRDQVASRDPFELALGKFESLSFPERVSMALRLTQNEPLTKDVEAAVAAQIEFRNATVHDAPWMRDEHGNLLRTKRGRVGLVPEATMFGGHYPLLSSDPMALRLSHARRAVDGHDQVVAQFATGSEEFWENFLRSFGPAVVSSVNITAVGGSVWRDYEGVEAAWDQVLEWEAAIPREKHEEYMRNLLRRDGLKST